MITYVLLIHRQLAFAISFKQALERAGAFQVHPFISADDAIAYLKDNKQDIAIVDFGMPDAPSIVAALRAQQPDIAIIAAPVQPDSVIRELNLQGAVNARFTARDVLPLLNEVMLMRTGRGGQVSGATVPLPTGDLPELPTTQPKKSSDDESLMSLVDKLPRPPEAQPPRPEPTQRKPLTPRQERFVEFVLNDGMDDIFNDIAQGTRGTPVKPENVPQPSIPEPPRTTADLLAEEEPEFPEFEENGTVSDLVTSVTDKSFRNVMSIMRGEEELVEDESSGILRFSAEDLAGVFSPQQEDAPQQPDTLPEREFEYDFDDVPAQGEDYSSAKLDTELDLDLEQYLASLEPEIPVVEEPVSERFPFERPPQFSDTDTPARIVLEQTLGDSTQIDSFSVSELIASIESQLPENRPKVQPLPSWLLESEQKAEDIAQFVEEPDFLPDSLPEAELLDAAQPPESLPESPVTERFSDQATVVSQRQRLESETMDDATEWLQPTSEVFPDAPWLEETPAKPMPVEAVPEAAETADEASEVFAGEAFALAEPISDPYIAQLALSLTQVSLELTAEAALLAREGRIVAYAGAMDRVDMDDLRHAIDDDWEAQPRQARIRMVTIEDTGKEYMLYSKLTDDGFTLSLIFAGATPLRDIRKQSKRLLDALEAVPEIQVQEMPAPEDAPTQDAPEGVTELPTEESLTPEERAAISAAAGANGETMTAYAMVWLLRDPAHSLDAATSSAIISGMNVQLAERAWEIQDLQAKEDFVYLLANVPGDIPPYEIVRDLKRRSADIAHRQNPALKPDTLWADGYLVVTPGRQLDVDEIQQFINFERM
jgi:DNA-binding NarL/FixJ family response regulator/REP element-mobilizing transposase RayT